MTTTLSIVFVFILIIVGLSFLTIPPAIVYIGKILFRTYYLEKEEHYRRCDTDEDGLREMSRREKVH